MKIVGNTYPDNSPVSIAREAAAGGADAIQLRIKDLPDQEILKLARGIREVTAKENVLFIVNDRIDIALLANADGVHIGQSDLPASEARKLVGDDKILGCDQVPDGLCLVLRKCLWPAIVYVINIMTCPRQFTP